MRLLQRSNTGEFSLTEDLVDYDKIPPYAILSHTWGADVDEVTFKDLTNNSGQGKAGYEKVRFCGKQAAQDNLCYFWIDTCCIDKSNSTELSEAINSMYRWYQKATKCYVYLSDVSTTDRAGSNATFQNSRWFTRGWTLQELLAPTSVEFFSIEGKLLGDRYSLMYEIASITGIPVQALQGRALSQFSIEERMNWASKRETKRDEDMAYSLLGIFDIHMPLIYGEGKRKAFKRLRKEIEEESRTKLCIPSRPLATEKTRDNIVEDTHRNHIQIESNGQPIGNLTNRSQDTTSHEHPPQVQSGDLSLLLIALQGQINQLSNKLNDHRHALHSLSIHDLENVARVEEDVELTKSIERLQAIMSKEGHMRSEKAEPFLSDLECILSSVLNAPNNRPASPSKRESKDLGEGEDISLRELKSLCGIVASSHSVSLNVRPARSEPAKKRKVLQKRKIREVAMQRYEMTIAQCEKSFSALQTGQIQLTRPSSTMETLTRIKVLKRFGDPMVLTAYLHYFQGQAGIRSLNPIISVGKILPDESPVFAIVKNGDVDQLQYLLNERQCSIRDRDTFGTPLLHYAMYQPKMCNFLIENGADVDEVAWFSMDREFRGPPLLEQLNDREEDDKDMLQAIIDCRCLLLQAGADPTLPDSEGKNAVFVCVSSGTADSLKAILDFGEQFIDLEDKDGGETALLHLAGNWSMGYDDSMFKLLLDRGADIDARNHLGENCLQIAVRCAGIASTVEQEMEAIILLIQRGANVFTTDNVGLSIFDEAYQCNHDSRSPLGGYVGDLWDAVLSRCDYGEHMRQPDDRLHHYTKRYTQEDFRRLWRGREHLCPYIQEHSRPCPSYSLMRYPSEESSSSGEDEEAFIEELSDSEGLESEKELLESDTNDEIWLTDSEQDQSDFADGGVTIGLAHGLD